MKAYPTKGFRKFLWGGKSAVMAEKPKLLPFMCGTVVIVEEETPQFAFRF